MEEKVLSVKQPAPDHICVTTIQRGNRLEYVCPECGNYMQVDVSGGMQFPAGNVTDNIRESLYCQKCGLAYEFDQVAYPKTKLPEVEF